MGEFPGIVLVFLSDSDYFFDLLLKGTDNVVHVCIVSRKSWQKLDFLSSFEAFSMKYMHQDDMKS